VVATQWKVDDIATQELMRRFYQNLWGRNQSKIDALRNAQLWMLRHPKELEDMGIVGATTRGGVADLPKRAKTPRPAGSILRTDPFFWAAFQLSGDWR
jgi:CHAT domain-containing protein